MIYECLTSQSLLGRGLEELSHRQLFCEGIMELREHSLQAVGLRQGVPAAIGFQLQEISCLLEG
jgi:hypothetical protein